MLKYQPSIGLEIHVELKTDSKMFCGCPADHFAKKPNSQTCPVCLGLPGALPVPNKKAIDWTILTGLALHCQINRESSFDRKHYFYPDLPKGYQISQFDDPFCIHGYLALNSAKKIRLNRVHLEEDTAKLQHTTIKAKPVSLIDFNRSGVPLMEIVTEPDINTASEAKEFLKKLRDILRALKVSDCDMEKGSMRLEANISLSATDQLADYKVEVKNLNSFRFVEQAIDFEIKRQAQILKERKVPDQETRGYNAKTQQTFSQRSKEAAKDYRYFPDPDIPPIVLTDPEIDRIKKLLPRLPEEQIGELVERFKIKPEQAKLLVVDEKKLAYFNQHVSQHQPKELANLIINKKVDLNKPLERQLKKTIDVDAAMIDRVLKENPDVVAKYKAGKTSVLAFLVGQVMRLTKGKANPQLTQKILCKRLGLKK